MIARHYIDTDVNCVFIEHIGAFEVGEGPANMWDILADPAFRPGMKFFRDASRTLAMPILSAPKIIVWARSRSGSAPLIWPGWLAMHGISPSFIN